MHRPNPAEPLSAMPLRLQHFDVVPEDRSLALAPSFTLNYPVKMPEVFRTVPL